MECMDVGYGGPCIVMLPQPGAQLLEAWQQTLKVTIEKKGASSRIDPGMACSSGGGLWGSAIPAPVFSPPMLFALYSVLMIMYCMHLALHGVYGCVMEVPVL